MRVLAALTGNLEQHMAAEIRDAEIGVTRGIAAGAEGLKAELRAQVTGAGLGERLAKTWRSEVYPPGKPSTNAAAMVWSKAPLLMDAFNRGATIRPGGGRQLLAIPTSAAGKVAGSPTTKRLTPELWQKRTGLPLRYVQRPGRLPVLVADGVRVNSRGAAVSNMGKRKDGSTYTRLRNVASAVIFILVPQARLKKRLDIEAAGRKWQGRVPGLVLENWP